MNKLTKLRRRAQSLFFPSQKQRDEGAGIVEYAAILILVAAVAAAVFALGLPSTISDAIGSTVVEVLQSDSDSADTPDADTAD